MANLNFDKEITALLVKGVARANACVPHMLQLLTAARSVGVRVFYAMHHRYRPRDYETWKYIAPIQKAAWSRKTFEYGSGTANSVPSLRLNAATLWPRSIGAPAALPTRTWICSSKSTAFTS